MRVAVSVVLTVLGCALAPAQVVQWGNTGIGQMTGFPTGQKFVAVSAGAAHTVGIKPDGTLVQWGDTTWGQMAGFPAGQKFVAVSAGLYHTVGIKPDGTLDQWGDTYFGQMAGFPAGQKFVAVSAGYEHTVGIKPDGTLDQWGDTPYGLMAGFPTGHKFVAVSAGVYHTVGAAMPVRQWTTTRLHPAGATESSASGVDIGMQGGYVDFGQGRRATFWTGDAASATDLHGTSPWPASEVVAVDNGKQYGNFYFGPEPGFGNSLGAEWDDTPGSAATMSLWWSLNEASTLRDAQGGKWVGDGNDGDGGQNIATIWNGGPDAFNVLHWGVSHGFGIGGAQQVGDRFESGYMSAYLWSGTLESAVSLHPDGATTSVAYGTDGLQQVGSATFAGVEMAGAWTGTPDSWKSLHPAGASSSRALRVSEGKQVGYVVVNGVKVASYWESSAGSWVDLRASLPAEFAGQESVAKDIWVDGNTVTIVGDAINGLTGRREAVMWVSGQSATPPETAILESIDGQSITINGGGLSLSDRLFATFNVTDDVDVAAVQYSLDGGAWTYCGLSQLLTNLTLGHHTLLVRAVDTDGIADPTPASHSWTVVTPAEAIQAMIGTVSFMSIPPGKKNQLKGILNSALTLLSDSNPSNDGLAKTLLQSFISACNLPPVNSQPQTPGLIQMAQAVIASI